jgi:hypothetical protein
MELSAVKLAYCSKANTPTDGLSQGV